MGRVILLTSTGPIKVDPTKIALGKLQAAVVALGLVAGGAITALQVTPGTVPAPSCIQAEEVFYSQPDTLFWVPLHGTPQRDSILKLEGLPDSPASTANTPVQVCFPHPVPNRPVWKS